ncbi:MAG: hypothetical protein CSA54_02240 [Gammaproteobacteria bacterium]|nr:MAG: hypothetical protein CSA54_02240 [Gammaproteobacteria bacterium]
MADREADIVALMNRAAELGHPADWLIRSTHNRTLPDGGRLWDSVLEEAPLGDIRFTLEARRGVKSRKVRQQLFLKRLSIPDGRKGKEKGTLKVTCLIAREVAPPKGRKALEWRLLSNREPTSLADAVELIDWYRCRWEIEMYFDILKNGCRIEQLQLKTLPKLEIAIALYMIVAWRINRLMRVGRECPDLRASLLFEPDEWAAAYILNEKTPPESEPTVNEVVRLTIWKGMKQVASCAAGMKFMRRLEDST